MSRTFACRFSLVVALAALGGCGGGGGGGGLAPEIEVFTQNALAANAGAVAMGVIGQDEFVAVPVAIRNTGAGVLNITGPIGVTPTACTCIVRDAAPAGVAAGDTGIFTLLFKAGTSGTPSAAISIPSNDADENPFAFTLAFTLNTPTRCTYTANVAGAQNLYASAFPGVPGSTQVNGGVAAGANGVQQNFHLGDRTLYVCQFASGGDTDICLRGLGGASPVAQTILTSTLSTPAGFFGPIKFAAGDNLVFTYNTGAGGAPMKLFSMTIAGAATGAPLEFSGALPVGSPTGVQDFLVSPRKDQVAFLGDFLTAGLHELFVTPFAGGARTRVSAPLSAGVGIDPSSIRWLPDQSGLLYETRVIASGLQRVLHLVRLGGAATPLNGPVPAGRLGVIINRTRVSASATHVLFLTDEASASGKRELRVISLIGGAVSGPGVLNSGVAGPAGVDSFGMNFDGTKALFIADSGANAEPELWQSLLAGSTPTTTKIVPTPAANRAVAFDGDRGILSSSVAWCTQNDAVVGRRELFFINWSTATPTLTRIINNATFPGGTGIVDLSFVHPQPDFSVAISSNQGNAGGGSVFGARFSASPGAVRLNALLSAGTPTVRGVRVMYEADAGAVPQNAWCNLITGGAEIQMGTSSSMTGAPVLFSEARGFWHTFTPNLFNASTTAAGTQQDTDGLGGADIGSVRLGFEPRP